MNINVLLERSRAVLAMLGNISGVFVTAAGGVERGTPRWDANAPEEAIVKEEDPTFSFVIGIPDCDRWVLVTMTVVDEPAGDPETGVWLGVTAARDAISCLIGISVAIAAAELNDRIVYDELRLLSGHRTAKADELLRSLAAHGAAEHVSTAAESVIANTNIRFGRAT